VRLAGVALEMLPGLEKIVLDQAGQDRWTRDKEEVQWAFEMCGGKDVEIVFDQENGEEPAWMVWRD
jgi:hypothetical protein